MIFPLLVPILVKIGLPCFAVYHIIRYFTGSKKHRIGFVNIVLAAVVLFSLAGMGISESLPEEKGLRTIWGGMKTFTQTDAGGNEYYVFEQYGPFISEKFVVAKQDAIFTSFSRFNRGVIIYYEHNAGGYERAEVGGASCDRINNVVKITPDYFGLMLVCAIVSGLTLIVFDIIMLAAASVQKQGMKEGVKNAAKE